MTDTFSASDFSLNLKRIKQAAESFDVGFHFFHIHKYDINRSAFFCLPVLANTHLLPIQKND